MSLPRTILAHFRPQVKFPGLDERAPLCSTSSFSVWVTWFSLPKLVFQLECFSNVCRRYGKIPDQEWGFRSANTFWILCRISYNGLPLPLDAVSPENALLFQQNRPVIFPRTSLGPPFLRITDHFRVPVRFSGMRYRLFPPPPFGPYRRKPVPPQPIKQYLSPAILSLFSTLYLPLDLASFWSLPLCNFTFFYESHPFFNHRVGSIYLPSALQLSLTLRSK